LLARQSSSARRPEPDQARLAMRLPLLVLAQKRQPAPAEARAVELAEV
jgi:hypothetical protein